MKNPFTHELHQYLLTVFRYAYEPELKEAARLEWQRLSTLIEGLQPYKVPETDIEVQAKGWPTNSDGKTATYWSGRACMQNCYVCDASPTDMLHNVVKEPRPETYIFGIRTLHVRLRIFDWLCKFYFHWPWKTASCRQDLNNHIQII